MACLGADSSDSLDGDFTASADCDDDDLVPARLRSKWQIGSSIDARTYTTNLQARDDDSISADVIFQFPVHAGSGVSSSSSSGAASNADPVDEVRGVKRLFIAASESFEALFTGGLSESASSTGMTTVRIEGIDIDTFRDLKRYVHSGAFPLAAPT